MLRELPSWARRAIAETELDAEDRTRVIWEPLDHASGLHLYPAVGPALADFSRPQGEEAASVLLPPITDENYTWR